MTKHRSKQERRTQILRAAASCFAEKGYYEASMDDKVAASGLSKGSLYWYFKNKREVFRTLMDQWFEEIAIGFEEAFTTAESPSDKVRAVFRIIETSAALRPELVRAQFEFLSFAIRDAEYAQWLQGMYGAIIGYFEAIVAEGVAAGRFRAVDANVFAWLIAACIDGVLLQQQVLTEGPVQPPSWPALADLLLALVET